MVNMGGTSAAGGGAPAAEAAAALGDSPGGERGLFIKLGVF